MRKILNLVLFLLILGLIYVLYQSIAAPIKFSTEKEIRENAVVERLKDIRNAQEHYRGITGSSFAGSFKELKDTLTHGTFILIKLDGDVDDPENSVVTRDTTYVPARDSIPKLGFNLDSLQFIPYSQGKSFKIEADTLTYQKTLVNVVEVKAQYKDFMGKYADERFKRYDDFYDPSDYLKFGDMSKPNISGNWER